MKRIRNFLFKNTSQKQTIFKNTFWLSFSEVIVRLLKLSLIIYVARILGATEYGKFTFAFAFISLFAIFSDLGISPIVARDIAKDKEKEKEFSSVLSLKILLAIGGMVAVFVGSFFITSDPLIRKLIWVLGIYASSASFSSIIYAFLQARQRMEYQAWIVVFQTFLVTGAGFFVLFNFPSVRNLGLAYLFASLASLILLLFIFNFKFFRLKLSFNKTVWKNLIKVSWPLALAGMFATVYNSIDSVMMGYWGQITETGWYNASYKIIGITLIPMGLIGQVFYPALSRFSKKSKESFQNIWNKQMEMMIILAVPIMVGGIALAPKIIKLIYSESFLPATLSLKILLIMTAILFLSNPIQQAIVVFNQQKKLFWITMTGAIINIFLNFLLIPKYSLNGAAIATLITYAIVFFLLIKLVVKFSPIHPINLKFFSALTVAIIASIPMYFVITYSKIYNLNVIFSVIIGTMIYFLFILSAKKILKKNRMF
ncbi:flippase [bacterium]|nr:MAG: flippase [bacterium]